MRYHLVPREQQLWIIDTVDLSRNPLFRIGIADEAFARSFLRNLNSLPETHAFSLNLSQQNHDCRRVPLNARRSTVLEWLLSEVCHACDLPHEELTMREFDELMSIGTSLVAGLNANLLGGERHS